MPHHQRIADLGTLGQVWIADEVSNITKILTCQAGFAFNRQNPRPRLRSRNFAVKTAV